jgi:hypothetical protein
MAKHTVQQTTNSRLKCTNCQIRFLWLPVLVDGQPYCCAGCAEGGPCSCDYSRLPEMGERHAIVLDHSEIVTYLRS